MKTLKIAITAFTTAIAWIGVLIMILGILVFGDQVIDFIRFPVIMHGDGSATLWIFLIGLLLVLIGGFTAKPSFLWLVLVIIGIIFTVLTLIDISYQGLLGYIVIPGLVCMADGLLILWLKRKQKIKADT
jgi:hypothetical protein